ncbi:hypothetical protein Patl1_08288 [Pistacia atlantica]|uniref:Uncharacterized protein n=1 Tax=Pistacia atlantica TaxID=434234 RepID=A0ACC1AJP7_9ROSI|nr:hypothetical protein Patl1_08288 [Pistacia atlantica]
MKLNMAKLIFFFLFLLLSFFTTLSIDNSCPMDLSYVQTYPWDKSLCLQEPNGTNCCQALLSLIGMGLAQHLRDTSNFDLANLNVSFSCLTKFQDKLSALSIDPAVVPFCFKNYTQFVTNTSSCAGIQTKKDWIEKAGQVTPLDTACKNMTGLTQCTACLDAGYTVTSQLVGLAPNSTKCFYFAILYAAGILNDPKDPNAAACILGLSLAASNPSMSRESIIKLAFALSGAVTGVLLAFVIIIVYRKWDKKRKRNALHDEFVSSFKASVLPNCGAKWPTIAEALKMLEGDIDIPRLPERPLPLSHESFRSSLWQSTSRNSSRMSIV